LTFNAELLVAAYQAIEWLALLLIWIGDEVPAILYWTDRDQLVVGSSISNQFLPCVVRLLLIASSLLDQLPFPRGFNI